jgi:AraC-like DNA-binding protein
MESPLLRELCATADRLLSLESVTEHSSASLVLGLLRKELAQVGHDSPLVPPLSESLRLYLLRAPAAKLKEATQGAESPHVPHAQLMGDARVWKAVGLMQQAVSQRWTVQRLAKAVGMSRPVLARQFVSTTGLSPLRYLTRCRMELAAAILRESNAGLAEIASQVGYESEYAFNRAFKRHHEVSPGAFRRRSHGVGAMGLRSAA